MMVPRWLPSMPRARYTMFMVGTLEACEGLGRWFAVMDLGQRSGLE